MFRFFVDQKRRTAEGGFTLIELVVVLAILGILLALAVPRYLGARKRAFKAEIDNILQETKTLSWAYYQEYGSFAGISSVADIGVTMPASSVWTTPAETLTGVTQIQWASSGGVVSPPNPLTTADACSVILRADGSSSQGCAF